MSDLHPKVQKFVIFVQTLAPILLAIPGYDPLRVAAYVAEALALAMSVHPNRLSDSPARLCDEAQVLITWVGSTNKDKIMRPSCLC